jgi:hypothetical protein
MDKFAYVGGFSAGGPVAYPTSKLFPDPAATRQQMKLLFLCIGTDDSLSYCDGIANFCNSNNIPCTYYKIPGRGHNWTVWEPSLWNFAQMACTRGFTDNGTPDPTPTSTPTPTTTPTPTPIVTITPTPTPTHGNVLDVNHDGVINMLDVVKVAVAFNTAKGNAKFVDAYDFNRDGAINMLDIVMIAAKFNTIA